jgi:hypothetical protein
MAVLARTNPGAFTILGEKIGEIAKLAVATDPENPMFKAGAKIGSKAVPYMQNAPVQTNRNPDNSVQHNQNTPTARTNNGGRILPPSTNEAAKIKPDENARTIAKELETFAYAAAERKNNGLNLKEYWPGTAAHYNNYLEAVRKADPAVRATLEGIIKHYERDDVPGIYSAAGKGEVRGKAVEQLALQIAQNGSQPAFYDRMSEIRDLIPTRPAPQKIDTTDKLSYINNTIDITAQIAARDALQPSA